MAYTRRSYAGGAPATTLTGGPYGTGDLTFSIASATGWPTGSNGNFTAIIGRGTATEEKVDVESRSGTSLTISATGRGYDGSSAQTHAAGDTIELAWSATEASEANLAVSKTIGQVAAKGDLLVGVAVNDLDNVTVGTDYYVLVADATASTGVAWAKIGPRSITGLTGIPQGSVVVVDGTNSLAYITAAGADGIPLVIDSGESGRVSFSPVSASGVGIDAVVGYLHILDASVTSAKLANADGAGAGITAGKIEAGAVTEAKILDGAVSAAKAKSEAWTAGSVTATNVTTSSLVSRYIQRGKSWTVRLHATLSGTPTSFVGFSGLPFTAVAGSDQCLNGYLVAAAGGGTRVPIVAKLAAGATAITRIFADGAGSGIDATHPFAIASGDEIVLFGEIEGA